MKRTLMPITFLTLVVGVILLGSFPAVLSQQRCGGVTRSARSYQPLLPLLLRAAPGSSIRRPFADQESIPVLECTYGSIHLKPDDDIQSIVNAHSPGTTYCLTAGVYRQVSITPHAGDTFVGVVDTAGNRRSILNGSTIVSGFSRVGQGWAAPTALSKSALLDPRTGSVCAQDYPRCKYVNELFYDGCRLRHVANLDGLAPGTWFLDTGSGTIRMADSPDGHLVELSITPWAFNAASSPQVTLKTLVIEKYANGTQGSTLGPDGCAPDWRLDSNEFRLNHGNAACVAGASIVVGNYIHDQGQLGLSGVSNGILVERNEISNNKEAGYLAAWEAGGTKFLRGWNLVIRNNYVHDNNGPGLWTDYDNHNSTFELNHTARNLNGINVELSFDQKIRYNIVEAERHTATDPSNGTNIVYGGSINSVDSRRTEMYGNTVVATQSPYTHGIIAVRTDRIDASPKSPTTSELFDQVDLNVHDNLIIQFQGVAAGAATYSKSPWSWNRNRFANNTYKLDNLQANRFGWSFGLGTAAQWKAVGNDVAGVWLPTGSGDVPSTVFVAFDRVETVSDTQIWSLPSTKDLASRLLNTASTGARGTVTRIGGPIFTEGDWWWQVQYDSGVMGWTRQGQLRKTTVQDVGAHVTLSSPADGGTVAGMIRLVAGASSGLGVGVVEFRVDGNVISEEIVNPYSTTLDSTTLTNGTHTLAAVVYDLSGSVLSNTIRVDVENLASTPVSSILENGDFESGTNVWQFYSSGTGTFTAEPGYAGQSAKLSIVTDASNIQLFQCGLILAPGTTYRLTFVARSPTSRPLAVAVLKHAPPYTNYGLQMSEIDLTDEWATYTLEFTTDGLSGQVSDGRLMFWFAPFAVGGDEYWLDNVTLIRQFSDTVSETASRRLKPGAGRLWKVPHGLSSGR